MSSDVRAPQHGRDHRPGGSDPIYPADIEYGIYEGFSTSASPQPQWTSFPLDNWEFIGGTEVLDVSDATQLGIPRDGTYTFNWQCYYTLADASLAPNLPAQGDFHGYQAHFFLGSGTNVLGFIFPEGEVRLPLEVFQAGIAPLVSATLRVPLQSGDAFSGAFVQHDVPGGAAESRFFNTGTPAVNLMVTWEPQFPPDFPV